MELIIFSILVILFLYLDMRSGQTDKPVSLKKATAWSLVWIGVSLIYAIYLLKVDGIHSGTTFIAAYFLEKSLAVDNLFVFMAIFASFEIAERYHHHILQWGILGALAFRAIFIGFGIMILSGAKSVSIGKLFGHQINPVSIIFFIFGILVLYSAYSLFRIVIEKKSNLEEEIKDYSNHWSIRYLHKFIPNRISTSLDNHKFFTFIKTNKVKKTLAVTPLFLCLIVVELSDIMFAFDSVPAIFAITQDPKLVYTSNIFAVLGLRSMYFLLAAAKRYLCHLDKAVFLILGFIGIKMVAFEWIHISPTISLSIILGLLIMGIIYSFISPIKTKIDPII